jgi:predicted membrane channel-forming protein YqfA (hemolysin III family)
VHIFLDLPCQDSMSLYVLTLSNACLNEVHLLLSISAAILSFGVIFTQLRSDSFEKVSILLFLLLSVSSIVGDKFVAIMYSSSPEDFDKYLPIVNRIIQSVKIK